MLANTERNNNKYTSLRELTAVYFENFLVTSIKLVSRERKDYFGSIIEGKFVEKLEMKNFFSQDSQWFAIIEAERYEIMGNSINKKNYFDKLYETKMNLVNQMKASGGAGVTMYDGGAALENWSDILGKTTYRHLLEKIFSKG